MAQISKAFRRSTGTLIEDVAGVAALVTMLLVGLHLPGMM